MTDSETTETLLTFKQLLSIPRYRDPMTEYLGEDLLADLEKQVDRGATDLDTALIADCCVEAIQQGGDVGISVGWDGNFPGNSGATYVHGDRELGVYVTTSSDFDPGGPFASLEDLIDETFAGPIANPEIWSNSVPEETLLEIARRVADWQNEGQVYVNDQLYVCEGKELVLGEERTNE